MSLTGELRELFELYKLGALSEDEFKAAKSKLLAGDASTATPVTTPTPPTPPPPSQAMLPVLSTPSLEGTTSPAAAAAPSQSEQTHSGPPDPAQETQYPPLHPFLSEEVQVRFARLTDAVTLLIQAQLCEYTADAHGARLTAYQHLYTVFDNLSGAPQNARFRRLRLSNAVLSRELWPVPGCLTLLSACGFAAQEDAKDGTCLVLTTNPTETVERAQEALNAIVFCRREMEEQEKRRQNTRGLLGRNVTLEIRLENAQAAAAKGELESFLIALFTKDEAGDDLRTVRAHLAEMASLVATWGTCEADMSVNLDELQWYRAIVRQRGALELFLVGGHGSLRHAPVSAPPEASTKVVPPTHVELVLPGVRGAAAAEEPVAWQQTVAQLLRGVTAAVESTQAARREAERTQAQAAAAVMRRREKMRLDHEQERLMERGAEVGPRPQRRLGTTRTASRAHHASDSSSSDDDGERKPNASQDQSEPSAGDEEAGGKGKNGKRVPLSTALAFLMGKDVD